MLDPRCMLGSFALRHCGAMLYDRLPRLLPLWLHRGIDKCVAYVCIIMLPITIYTAGKKVVNVLQLATQGKLPWNPLCAEWDLTIERELGEVSRYKNEYEDVCDLYYKVMSTFENDRLQDDEDEDEEEEKEEGDVMGGCEDVD